MNHTKRHDLCTEWAGPPLPALAPSSAQHQPSPWFRRPLGKLSRRRLRLLHLTPSERYPLTLHGFACRIGSADALNWGLPASFETLPIGLTPVYVFRTTCLGRQAAATTSTISPPAALHRFLSLRVCRSNSTRCRISGPAPPWDPKTVALSAVLLGQRPQRMGNSRRIGRKADC